MNGGVRVAERTFQRSQDRAHHALTFDKSMFSQRAWRQLSGEDKDLIALWIYDQVRAGYTQTQIAETLGTSQAQISRMKSRATGLLRMPAIENTRREHVDMCDRMIAAFEPDAARGDAKAADQVLKWMAERGKVIGVYAPEQVQVNLSDTREDLEMADLVASAKAQAHLAAQP